MADGDLIVDDYSLEYRGLLLTGEGEIAITRIEGLVDLPPVRSGDQPLLRRHGSHPGDDFADVRTVLVQVEFYAHDNARLAELVAALQAATAPGADEAPLVFQIPGVAGGSKARLWCRPRRRSLPVDFDDGWFHRVPRGLVEFVATDPALLDNTEQNANTTLPTSAGGLTFPAVFPLLFGAVSTGGAITALNAGSFDADCTFRIDGPCDNPRIESITAGRTLAWNGSLALGEFLVLDTKSRTVLLNGTASRYWQLDTSSRWFTLAPGDNEITFRATTPSAATLNMVWRSTWL